MHAPLDTPATSGLTTTSKYLASSHSGSFQRPGQSTFPSFSSVNVPVCRNLTPLLDTPTSRSESTHHSRNECGGESTPSIRTSQANPRRDRKSPSGPYLDSIHKAGTIPERAHPDCTKSQRLPNEDIPIVSRSSELPEPYSAIPVLEKEATFMARLKREMEKQGNNQNSLQEMLQQYTILNLGFQWRYASDVRRRRRAMIYTLKHTEDGDLRDAAQVPNTVTRKSPIRRFTYREVRTEP